jgi:hypothetical protein
VANDVTCKCGAKELESARPIVQRDGAMTYTRHATESCEPGRMKTYEELNEAWNALRKNWVSE